MAAVTAILEPRGYSNPGYVQSFAEFGDSFLLPRSGGALVLRNVPSALPLKDAIGPYPMLVCEDWDALGADLAELPAEVVSVVTVCDPLSAPPPAALRQTFRDVVRPFKRHFVVDLADGALGRVSNHHLREIRKSLRCVRVDICDPPLQWLDHWCVLYEAECRRLHIGGMAAPGRAGFAVQLSIPGCFLLRASVDDRIIAMQMWMVNNRGVAHGHLVAMDDEGRRRSASYALYASAFELLAKHVEHANLGGVPGKIDEDSAIARFKQGWGARVRVAHLCGRILDPYAYSILATDRRSDWFPAYRGAIEAHP